MCLKLVRPSGRVDERTVLRVSSPRAAQTARLAPFHCDARIGKNQSLGIQYLPQRGSCAKMEVLDELLLGGTTLRDFDWSCRLVLSSNRFSTMRVPVLLLKLSLEKPGGETEDVVMELEREKLDAVLEKLAGAHQVLHTSRSLGH